MSTAPAGGLRCCHCEASGKSSAEASSLPSGGLGGTVIPSRTVSESRIPSVSLQKKLMNSWPMTHDSLDGALTTTRRHDDMYEQNNMTILLILLN